MKYNIKKEDIEYIDKKVNFQAEYLKRYKSTINQDTGEFALSSVYSATHNPKKYFAEINNRVNNIVSNAKNQGLKPIFITITAPSKFHKKYKNGDLLISPKDTAKELSKIFNSFTKLKIFDNIKKEYNYKMTYFRVYEPHKSGVPHLHAMLFLPTQTILSVKKRFYSYLTSNKWGNNKKSLDFKYTWYKDKGGAVGYIMKYILKSFKNEDNEQDLQLTTYWYLKFRVIRFLSSRSLASLSVYRKIRYFFKNRFKNDLVDIKTMIDNGQIYPSFCEFNKDGSKIWSTAENINFRYIDKDGEIVDLLLWSKSTEAILYNRSNSDGRFHIKY